MHTIHKSLTPVVCVFFVPACIMLSFLQQYAEKAGEGYDGQIGRAVNAALQAVAIFMRQQRIAVHAAYYVRAYAGRVITIPVAFPQHFYISTAMKKTHLG